MPEIKIERNGIPVSIKTGSEEKLNHFPARTLKARAITGF
jgi:hypothetical protein